MMPGELRRVHHAGDVVKHVEIIVSLLDEPLCVHVRIENSSLAPDCAGCGEVELREPLLEISCPTGWRCRTLWSER
jgi:hypothetical protein